MKIVNKFYFVIIILLIMFNMGSSLFYEVHAAKSVSEMLEEATGFIEAGEGEATDIMNNMDEITGEFVTIGQLLSMIGAGVMIAVTTYMGIKYVVSGPEAQAKLKQQLVGVIVSGIVIFGAYGIWKFVINIAKTFE